MNFILLTDYYHPIVKSGSIIVGDLVNELTQEGHSLTVVTFADNQSKKCQITVEEGLQVMNDNEFGNGSVIYTQNGYYAREFAKRTDSGMVGVNVGIPVPLAVFGFTGRKNSFFGDLHTMGTDGIRFFTELKSVTAHWFSDEEVREAKVENSWDGMISMPDKK